MLHSLMFFGDPSQFSLISPASSAFVRVDDASAKRAATQRGRDNRCYVSNRSRQSRAGSDLSILNLRLQTSFGAKPRKFNTCTKSLRQLSETQYFRFAGLKPEQNEHLRKKGGGVGHKARSRKSHLQDELLRVNKVAIIVTL